MIGSAEEFIQLRWSSAVEEYERAAHDEASVQVWSDVIGRHPDARIWVARNKTVPLEILEVLAADPDPDVRLAVSMKRSLTAELLESMAKDEDPSVRRRVAMHRNTPREIIQRLTQDEDPLVREAAGERINAP